MTKYTYKYDYCHNLEYVKMLPFFSVKAQDILAADAALELAVGEKIVWNNHRLVVYPLKWRARNEGHSCTIGQIS